MMGNMLSERKTWIAKVAEWFRPEGRRDVRLPAEFRATITATFGTVAVSGVDAHRKGLAVQSPEGLALGTLVFLRITSLGLMGFAHVRHCAPRGDGFLLGLEFREALTRERQESESWHWQQLSQTGRPLWDQAEI